MPAICRLAPASPNMNIRPPMTMATRERASGPAKEVSRFVAACSQGDWAKARWWGARSLEKNDRNSIMGSLRARRAVCGEPFNTRYGGGGSETLHKMQRVQNVTFVGCRRGCGGHASADSKALASTISELPQ